MATTTGPFSNLSPQLWDMLYGTGSMYNTPTQSGGPSTYTPNTNDTVNPYNPSSTDNSPSTESIAPNIGNDYSDVSIGSYPTPGNQILSTIINLAPTLIPVVGPFLSLINLIQSFFTGQSLGSYIAGPGKQNVTLQDFINSEKVDPTKDFNFNNEDQINTLSDKQLNDLADRIQTTYNYTSPETEGLTGTYNPVTGMFEGLGNIGAEALAGSGGPEGE
jgi:hypothetical protein